MSWLARALSIIGHPLVLLPCVVMALTLRYAGRQQALIAGVCFLAFAALVMAWSRHQVSRGHWRHIDASQPNERRALNRFLLITLATAAALAWWPLAQHALALGLALCAMLIVLAAATAKWWKLSLHVACAAYTATVLALLGAAPPGPISWVIAILLVGAIAWSRWHLGRHQPRDLAAGAVSGCLAGLLFWQLAQHWPAAIQ